MSEKEDNRKDTDDDDEEDDDISDGEVDDDNNDDDDDDDDSNDDNKHDQSKKYQSNITDSLRRCGNNKPVIVGDDLTLKPPQQSCNKIEDGDDTDFAGNLHRQSALSIQPEVLNSSTSEWEKQFYHQLTEPLKLYIRNMYNQSMKKGRDIKDFLARLNEIPQWSNEMLANAYDKIVGPCQTNMQKLLRFLLVSKGLILTYPSQTLQQSYSIDVEVPKFSKYLHNVLIDLSNRLCHQPWLAATGRDNVSVVSGSCDDVTFFQRDRMLEEIVRESLFNSMMNLIPCNRFLEKNLDGVMKYTTFGVKQSKDNVVSEQTNNKPTIQLDGNGLNQLLHKIKKQRRPKYKKNTRKSYNKPHRQQLTQPIMYYPPQITQYQQYPPPPFQSQPTIQPPIYPPIQQPVQQQSVQQLGFNTNPDDSDSDSDQKHKKHRSKKHSKDDYSSDEDEEVDLDVEDEDDDE